MLPRNGGDKNYLEYVYKHPRFMATCVYAMYGLFIVSHLLCYLHSFFFTGRQGWGSANPVIFGECTHPSPFAAPRPDYSQIFYTHWAWRRPLTISAGSLSHV